MKIRLMPMFAGLLILFTFGAAQNTYAGNFDFDKPRAAVERIRFVPTTLDRFKVPANIEFKNFDQFSKKTWNFDVAVKQNFDSKRNFEFGDFATNRWSKTSANVFDFDFVNPSGLDFDSKRNYQNA